MAMQNTLARVKTHYDKLIAAAIMLVLLSSLLYLAFRIGSMQKESRDYEQRILAKQPKYPHAEKLDTTVFDSAVAALRTPFQLPVTTNGLVFVPAERFSCGDCQRPIPGTATNCPFCLAVVPPERWEQLDGDEDADGMTNGWEKANGLNPFDASDRNKDFDNDDFTNYEEYQARTDPRNKSSSPDIAVKMAVEDIAVQHFSMRFKGKIKMPEEIGMKFQINMGRNTFFCELKKQIGETGFIVSKYDEKFVQETDTSVGERKRDVSELTLRKGDKEIVLVFDQEKPHTEARATLLFDPDKQSFPNVEAGSVFELRGNKYTVIRIDNEQGAVVISNNTGGKQLTIRRAREGRAVSEGEGK